MPKKELALVSFSLAAIGLIIGIAIGEHKEHIKFIETECVRYPATTGEFKIIRNPND